jgi:hypothetical protein
LTGNQGANPRIFFPLAQKDQAMLLSRTETYPLAGLTFLEGRHEVEAKASYNGAVLFTNLAKEFHGGRLARLKYGR